MDTVKQLLEKAKELEKEKKYQEIIDLLTDEILKEHNRAALYACRGDAFDDLNKLDEAINDYNKAVRLNPHEAYLYYNRGIIWGSKKEWEKAIDDFNKAIKINPNSAEPYNNRGIAWKFKKEWDKAIQDYNKATEIDPEYAYAYNNRGNSLSSIKKWDEAIQDYNKAIELNPEFTDAYFNRGIAWDFKKEWDKAIQNYDKAIELNPDFSDAHYNRGNVLIKKREWEKAIDDYEKYLLLTPDKNDYYAKKAKANIEELKKLKANAYYETVGNIVEQIKTLLVFKEDCITHYTTLSTAKIVILESSRFRLSEGTFLNDTSEGRVLYNYLDFHTSKNNNTGTDEKTIAEPFVEKPFIGSFVPKDKHDDLTLWRMYGKEKGKEAEGCALTIHCDAFIEVIRDFVKAGTKDSENQKSDKNALTDANFTFYRVAYLNDEAKDKFSIPGATAKSQKELNKLMAELQQALTQSEENKIIIAEKLNEIAYLFKSADYLYEHEIRLIIDGVGFNVALDKAIEIPKVYIELGNICPAIKQITLGPKVTRAEEWASAFHYHLKNTLPEQDTKIVISHLPFK